MEIPEGGTIAFFMVSVEDGMESDGSYRFSIKTMVALSLHHGMSRVDERRHTLKHWFPYILYRFCLNF